MLVERCSDASLYYAVVMWQYCKENRVLHSALQCTTVENGAVRCSALRGSPKMSSTAKLVRSGSKMIASPGTMITARGQGRDTPRREEEETRVRGFQLSVSRG